MPRNRPPDHRISNFTTDHPAPSRWYCDSCDQIIRCPKEGMLEWYDAARGNRDVPRLRSAEFRIVHNQFFSPLSGPHGCYRHAGKKGRADMHLNSFLGAEGMVYLLSFLDVGPFHNHKYEGPEVDNVREWVEIVRRLSLPYYEQARRLWPEAEADGLFDGINELGIFDLDLLRQIVRDYGPREQAVGGSLAMYEV